MTLRMKDGGLKLVLRCGDGRGEVGAKLRKELRACDWLTRKVIVLEFSLRRTAGSSYVGLLFYYYYFLIAL